VTYIIFEVKTEDVGKINQMLKDDLVSRQSLLTRDSSSLGIDKDVSYVKVEGSKDGLKKAEEIAKDLKFKKLNKKRLEEVNKKIEEQEDSAADGMGMIFG
jgi:predicted transcriptional regulator